MLKFSRSVFSSLPNGLQLTKPGNGRGILLCQEAIARSVEDAAGIVERVTEQPAEGHDAIIAVLGEVVEEDGPFRGDQTLDRLDEELVGERCLEPADPQAELGVKIEVEERIEEAEGVNPVLERDEVAEGPRDPATEHPPLPGKDERVVDLGLTRLGCSRGSRTASGRGTGRCTRRRRT